MARSAGKKSGQKGDTKKQKAAIEFRTGIPRERVDHLLKQFIGTVRTGLDLVLNDPSELSCKVLKQNPQWLLSPEIKLVLLTWAAYAAWDKPWAEFCQVILSDLEWQALVAVSDQASLDHRQAQFGQVVPRLVELAVHDALKAGDKQDNRSAAAKRAVEREFDQDIGVAEVLKRLKKRIRPMLKRQDQADRRRQNHRPRDYLSRSFILADLMRWLLHLPSTDALIRKLKKYAPRLDPGQINLQSAATGASHG